MLCAGCTEGNVVGEEVEEERRRRSQDTSSWREVAVAQKANPI